MNRTPRLTPTLILSALLTGASLTAGPTVTWTARPSLLHGYEETRAAWFDGRLFVVGGRTGHGAGHSVVTTVQVYDPVSDTWSLAAPLPEGRAAVGLAVVDDYLYCFGGLTEPYWWGRTSTSAFRYDPALDRWTVLAPMPVARSNFTIGVLDGKIYCAGGNVHYPNCTSQVDRYDPATGLWATVPSLPEKRGSTSGGTIAGKLVIAHGLVDPSTTRRQVFVYDPGTDAWTQPSNVDRAFASEAGFLFSDETWMYFGGAGASYETLISRFNPATGAIENLTPASPLRRWFMAAAADPRSKTCFLVGGQDATTTRLTTFESARLAPAPDYWWIVTVARTAAQGRAVHGLAPDGTLAATLYQPTGLSADRYLAAPAIRSDGRLVIHAAHREHEGPLYLGRLFSNEFIPLSDSFRDAPAGSIAWVPGDDAVLFSNVGSGVHRIDLDPATRDEAILTANYFDEVLFIDANRHVYFNNSLYRNPEDVFTMTLAGGDIQGWDPYDNNLAAWVYPSPDGRTLATLVTTGAWRSMLCLVSADGVPLTPLDRPLVPDTPNIPSPGGIAWSPDGQTLAVVRDGDLWTVNADGSDLKQVTHGAYPALEVWGAIALESSLSVALHPALTLRGLPGQSFEIQASPAIEPRAWTALTTLTLTNLTQVWFDPAPVSAVGQRFYRAVLQQR